MAQIYSYNTTAALPCRACGTGFKDSDYVVMFNNRRFHKRCFKCPTCSKDFDDPNANTSAIKPQVARELPYCPGKCYMDATKEHCAGCHEPIGVFDRFVKPKNMHNKKFHADCFKCTKCKVVMKGGFGMCYNHPYCPDCIKTRITPPV